MAPVSSVGETGSRDRPARHEQDARRACLARQHRQVSKSMLDVSCGIALQSANRGINPVDCIRLVSSDLLDVRCFGPASDPTGERPAWFHCNHEFTRTFTSRKHCVHLAKQCGEPTRSGFDALDGAVHGAGALPCPGRTSRHRPCSGASSPGRPAHGSSPSPAEATPAVRHRWRPTDGRTDCPPAWLPARSRAARRPAPIDLEPLPRVSRATGGHGALRRRASCATLVDGACFVRQRVSPLLWRISRHPFSLADMRSRRVPRSSRYGTGSTCPSRRSSSGGREPPGHPVCAPRHPCRPANGSRTT